MTKKDYQLIVKVLQRENPIHKEWLGNKSRAIAQAGWITICEDFAQTLQEENPSFNYDKFMEATK